MWPRVFATVVAWWNLGLPRLVPSPAQMSDTLPIDLNAAALGIGRHVSGIADPFNGHIDAFRISHVQRSDGWDRDHLEQPERPRRVRRRRGQRAGRRRPATAGRRWCARLPDGVSASVWCRTRFVTPEETRRGSIRKKRSGPRGDGPTGAA
jgi:hypothetical protein